MQNDVLKNEIAPWQEKGRWYHGVYDLSLADFITGKTDKYIIDNFRVVLSNNHRALTPLDKKIHIIDVQVKLTDITTTGDFSSAQGSCLYFTNGRVGRSILAGYANLTAGTSEFWAFVVED